MSLINLTPPAAEPVLVPEAKRYIKEDLADANNDADIAQAVKACRELCENDTRRALITQSWRLALNQFPGSSNFLWSGSTDWYYSNQWGSSPGPLLTIPDDPSLSPYAIPLPLPPLQTVDALRYIDTNGTLQTLDPSAYLVDAIGTPGSVQPAYGTSWPSTRAQPNAVQVDFTCGYGVDGTKVPACALQWIKANLGTVYEMRQSEIVMQRGTLLLPETVTRLLDPIRYRRY